MFSNSAIQYALAISVLVLRCNTENRNCCSQSPFNLTQGKSSYDLKVDSITIANPQIKVNYNDYGLYANFGFHFLIKDSIYYLMYMNSAKDSLVFVNIFNDRDHKLKSVEGLIRRTGKYTSKLSGDTLHILDIETYDYKQLKIDKNFYLNVIYESSLSKAFGSKDLFLNSNLVVDKKLVFFGPNIISFYGNFKTKNNLGEKVWRKVNVQTSEWSDLLDFPESYRKCYQRDFYSLIEKISDSTVVTVFRKLNKIFEVNVFTGEIKKVSEFLFTSRYMCYEKDQERNLAYTAKYDLLDEENSNLIVGDGKVFVIKRLVRNGKQEPVKCAILVFNKMLNQIGTYYPDKFVEPRLSFGFENGVVILSDSLVNAHYYGFK